MEKRRHEYNQGKKDAVLPFQHAVPAALTLTNTDYQMKTTRIIVAAVQDIMQRFNMTTETTM